MADDKQVIELAPPKIVQKGAASAKIVGMMAIAGLASVVGAEYRAANKTTSKPNTFLGSPFLVIAGATGATVVLVLIADFGGAPGEAWATGLATLVLLVAVLFQAAPVWKALSNVFKSGKVGGSPTTTFTPTPSVPTPPTHVRKSSTNS